MQRAPGQVSTLLRDFRHGSKDAAGQLVALFYPELRRIARTRMQNERPGHTLQPTALVNELYLELRKADALAGGMLGAEERKAFFGLAAHMMKRMLIHHARPLYRRADKVEFDEDIDFQSAAAEDMVILEDLLGRLEAIHPDLRTIVELRVFEGLSVQAVAEQTGIPARTVDRRWAFARQWLAQQLAA